jgi:uncharacterized membrane protein SpoIIM required for sporulation
LDFEQSLKDKSKRNPDELADLYIQLLNDLSFSQTYYPKSKTTIYLNFLVSQMYRKIYKTRRMDHNRVAYFFRTEVPSLMYQYRKQVLFAFVLFFFFSLLGALSARNDQTFVRLILGDDYVNMTLKNIDKGDPMAVYKSGNSMGSFIGITMNNIGVSAQAYIFGLSAGIFTFYAAFRNAIMLGSFQYFSYEQGVFVASLKGIWLHGAMEIFSIIISTAAGYILASSILFPKTYSRLVSFKTGVQDSLRIFISTVPFFITAGFIEGFVTRHSDSMPLWIDILIITGTLSVISFYYLIYPILIHKKQNHVGIPTLPKA